MWALYRHRHTEDRSHSHTQLHIFRLNHAQTSTSIFSLWLVFPFIPKPLVQKEFIRTQMLSWNVFVCLFSFKLNSFSRISSPFHFVRLFSSSSSFRLIVVSISDFLSEIMHSNLAEKKMEDEHRDLQQQQLMRIWRRTRHTPFSYIHNK